MVRGCRRRFETGVTLLELLITLSVAVILVTLAVPAYQGVMAKNRVANLTNQLSAALGLARSEAIKRGKQVAVCKSDDVATEDPSCSNDPAVSWREGWLVFVDDDNDETLDAGEVLLNVGQPPATNATIDGNGTFDNALSYSAAGWINRAGSFTLCIPPRQSTLDVNATGRVQVDGEQRCP